MSDKTKTTVWEERVIALEAEKKKRDALLAKQDEQLSAQTAQISGLSATVDALNAAEESRTKAASLAYVAQIKTEACAAGCAIPEKDIEQVQKQFDAGNPELAKTLGGAFLDRSKALGAGPAGGPKSKTVTLGVTEAQQADYEAEMADFRRRQNIKKKQEA